MITTNKKKINYMAHFLKKNQMRITRTRLLCEMQALFLSRIPKNHIQVQKETENLAVACLRPP